MVTVAYNAYCAILMEGDDDTCDCKTAGNRSWEVEATVNSLVGTLFHVIITRMGTDLIFLSRLGSSICFTNFGSHDPIVLYWNPWYTEPCYKGSLLYHSLPLSHRFTVMCSTCFAATYHLRAAPVQRDTTLGDNAMKTSHCPPGCTPGWGRTYTPGHS